MNKVSLNGVEIYPFDSEQSFLYFVNDNKGILVAINAEKILHATEDVYKRQRISVPIKLLCILPIFLIVKSTDDYALVMLCYCLLYTSRCV